MSATIVSLHDGLKKEFQSNQSDASKCLKLLSQLKTALSQSSFIVAPKGGSNVVAADPKELLLIRDVLEIGALVSIRNRDIPSFERYFSQLNTYYTDYFSLIPQSARMYMLLGLNLLKLLAQSRISDFHTALELIDGEKLFSDPYIKHVVQIEQCLMEGSYNKVWNARADVPAAEYRFFMDILMETIRNEIANSIEVAYDSLPVAGGCSLLYFSNKDMRELEKFVQTRGWKIASGGGSISFPASKQKSIAETSKSVNNDQVILQTIHYARELEKIV